MICSFISLCFVTVGINFVSYSLQARVVVVEVVAAEDEASTPMTVASSVTSVVTTLTTVAAVATDVVHDLSRSIVVAVARAATPRVVRARPPDAVARDPGRPTVAPGHVTIRTAHDDVLPQQRNQCILELLFGTLLLL